MNKVVLFLERMWLMVAIVCVLLSSYKAFFSTKEDALYFLFFGFVAALLWMIRRRIRRRMQQSAGKN